MIARGTTAPRGLVLVAALAMRDETRICSFSLDNWSRVIYQGAGMTCKKNNSSTWALFGSRFGNEGLGYSLFR